VNVCIPLCSYDLDLKSSTLVLDLTKIKFIDRTRHTNRLLQYCRCSL